MAGSIVSEPLLPHTGFNWVFLVELLIAGILTVFFLFYFNRLFATLVSYGIRAYTWRAYHAYIDIQALQISLLGGRIFFKDIRYHGHNETILIHGGYITWNYWLRRVRDASVFSTEQPPGDETSSTHGSGSESRSRTLDKAEKGGKQTSKRLPCRISIKISGVEAFLYNRSPAYDSIIEAFERKSKGSATSDGSEEKEECHFGLDASVRTSSDTREGQQSKLKKTQTQQDAGVARADTNSSALHTQKDPIPAFLRMLPIYIECNKGAIVVGNENTQSVMTAQFEKASGEFDASASGPLDIYQQVFNFQFTHPVVHMKPNPDFKASQLDSAARFKQEAEDRGMHKDADHDTIASKKYRRPKWRLPRLSGLFGRSSDSINTRTNNSGRNGRAASSQWQFPGQERWQGLSRYLDDNKSDGHGEWDPIQYAKTSLIVDCPCVNVSFYWDVPGPVPNELENSMHIDPVRPGDINGSSPPEYGMDIQVYGGVINYGPWADRHRAIFQSMFFPGASVDGVPALPLKVGDLRVMSLFKLYLSIEEDTTLRIPVREPSKDWKWKGKARTLAGRDKESADKSKPKARARRKSMRGKQRETTTSSQNVRPFAWIDVKVSGNSSVNYIMDMVASEKGFENKLDVDIVSTEITSSVNHGLLWRSGPIGLDCDLSNPISWNSLRKWAFNISCQDLELFMLRDHLFLLTDLVADWGMGPPPNYFTFVPFQYLLNINFTNFKLYLNTNDSNIINNPSELDENDFIVLWGQRLHGDVTIPLDKFRPLENEIRFDVRGQDMGLTVSMASKNTLDTFVSNKNLAQLGGLTLTGSHTYKTETSPMNTDRLFMDLTGEKLNVELYGWLIHHFLKLKDNYFGDYLHFKTLEEFQGLPQPGLSAEGVPSGENVAKVSNDLDVILCISVEQTGVLLPTNLYSADDCLRAELPYASADLRFTNYYMDLMVNFSPISLSRSTAVTSPGLMHDTGGQTEVFIASVAIFGHRLFGLPPAEPTYVCNWDFDVGKITGECTSEFIEKAAGAIRSFAFTLDDDENTLPIAEPPVIHDSTFLRLRTHDVHIWLHIANEVVLVSTGHVRLDFNDLAGTTFSQRLSAWIPDLAVGAVDAQSALRHRSQVGERHIVETHAFLQTDLTLSMLNRKLDFTENRNKQQSHIRMHDQRTNRAQFMLDNESSLLPMEQSKIQDNLRPPALPFPEIPHAIFLLQPSSRSGSSTISGYSSEGLSARGRKSSTSASRSTSSGSLASSIRSVRQYQAFDKRTSSSRSRTLLATSPPRMGSTDRHNVRVSEEERVRRNLPSFSVALSSSLAAPYFPLDQILPDMSDVPVLPTIPPRLANEDEDALIFNDVSSKHFDESFGHTSFLVSTGAGIRLYCTPEFVRCISNLIDLVQPCRPEDMLDDFQVKVMTKILDHQKRREGKGKSIELNVRIPFTHIRFQNEYRASAGTNAGKDQYDVILNQLKTSARIKSFPGERAGENSVSLHTTLGSLGLSVTERSPTGPIDDVAIQAEMRDLLVWVLKSKTTSANVTFRAFDVAAASQKVEYLASLIHRTTLLGEELGTEFAGIEKRHQSRLRFLAWHLTNVQEQYQDPAFLTKASYALRAVRDHLRSHDSWKIISRFRFIWHSLSDSEKRRAQELCSQPHIKCPENAEEKIIAMWDQWRTWDLAHVNKSVAMRMLFGAAINTSEAPLPTPLYLNIRSQGVKLIIDPGPKQSEAGLRILAINVALVPAAEPTGLMLVGDEIPKHTTIVQISSQESSVHVHWEISELIENLIQLFQKQSLKHSVRATKSPSLERKSTMDSSLQVVYITDVAELSLDTVNLQSISTGRRLRFSVVKTDDRASQVGQTTTVHLHLAQTRMELFSRARPLLDSQFDQPSIYFAHHERFSSDSVPDEIKVAAASRMIKFRVEEDILGLIEVADSVLRDEVAYLHEQTTKFQRQPKPEVVEDPEDDKNDQLPNVTLALLMDEYAIELALLQSLAWSIVGSSGRISVVPALGQNVTLRVDYDLAAHTHRMFSNSMDRSNVVSSLELPPVNGRIKVTNTEEETRVSASGIIETIELQASEIQALIATINKPEMSNVFTALREDVEVLQNHVEEIFSKAAHKKELKTSKPSRDLIYSVQMTLSGLNIRASAPGQHPDSATANLAVCLSSMQLKATNIGPDHTILALPEAVVLLHEVSVDLTLTTTDSIRRCGNVTFGAMFQATADTNVEPIRRVYRVRSSGLEVNIFADTASAVVDVMNYLQDKIKDLDLSKEKKYLQRLRHTKSRASNKRDQSVKSDSDMETESVNSSALFTSTYSIEVLDIYVSWIVGTSIAPFPRMESEDLVLSFRRIDLSTRKEDVARLMIEDMQLQMVPVSADKRVRSSSSALLPEVVFTVAYNSTKADRKIAFHAAGKSLDLQLASRFILPANVIERSIALAGKKFRIASANWSMTPTTTGAQRKNPFGNKRWSSLLVDANFAGAVVHINGSDVAPKPGTKESRSQQKGRYSQFVGDSSKSSLDLRAPGIALKVEYQDDGHDPSLNAELRVDGSNNTLFPTVVPVIIEMSESIKEVVREKDDESPTSAKPSESGSPAKPAAKLLEDDNLINVDPSTLLGRTRLNLGLRICKQEFSLSCQPIARVAAIAKLEDIYITVNSVKSQEHGHFFAASAAFEKLEATVQHVYSRESTFGFNVDSIILSLMNSKHLSGTSGISAILKINPMALQVNARQLQDFLLFREIWVPPEIRKSSKPTAANASQEPQEYLMQRYQQVTAATAFPWNANVSIADVSIDLDLGQAIGKTSLNIHNMWASSKKGIDWEQNLCIGVENIGIESAGRTSGFVALGGVRVRTRISWPSQELGSRRSPLIQASVGFRSLRVKAGFDYQAFVIADIANFDFLMYNVHEKKEGSRDRLVAILDGDKAHVFCTATSAAQGLALWQALERLVQENQQAYAQSLRDIEKFLRRKSSIAMPYGRSPSQSMIASKPDDDTHKAPISLHTDVVVTLRSINLGVFPSTFVDNQVLMLEAADAQARFAVALEKGKIHSGLGMTLGQLSVALSSISTSKRSKPVTELTVDDIVDSARSARGGTILRVPKVIANMHTWQTPQNNHIDYIFKSSLEGKVDVGWNYSRISFIRGMWSTHSRTLASRLGKPLPESNIKITQASSSADSSEPSSSLAPKESQEKITAVVNVPQSKYDYAPLEPPVIETPQLRDMGEATPPLEWIGLHRDRLPNVTHQIVIVTLLEVAREVEDAYGRILGSS